MRTFFYFWSAVGVLLTGLYWLMYRRGFAFLNHAVILLFFLLLPLLFCAVNVWGPNLEISPGNLRPIAYLGGYWLAFFHYSVYAGILYLLLRTVGFLAGSGEGWQHAYMLYAKGAFVAVMAILAYGGWNALHPVVRQVEHDTGKHLPQPVKIVLVTDIHLGTLFGRQYAEELTERINRQEADVVLFGGDQVDNSLNYLLREKSYEPLKNIKSKYGVYAVLGNHDHFDGRVRQEIELFRSVGFKMLVDEAVDLPCHIHLVGLEDYRSEPQNPYLESLAGKDPTKANLLLEHQPRRFLEAEQAGYDLYMAGHTHGGQQAPLNLVTRRMYLLDYGSKKFGNMMGVTSCGYGLWGSPVRIGSTPEIVVITLR